MWLELWWELFLHPISIANILNRTLVDVGNLHFGPVGCLSAKQRFCVPNSVSFEHKKYHFYSHIYIYRPYKYIYIYIYYLWNGPMLTHTYIQSHIWRSCSRLFCPPLDVTPQRRACQMPRRDHHCHLWLPPSPSVFCFLAALRGGAPCGSVWAAELFLACVSNWAAELFLACVSNSSLVLGDVTFWRHVS